jgi:hypothetical protein
MLECLELRWRRKSVRLIGACGQIANAASTYLCQYSDLIWLELMAFSSEVLLNVLPEMSESGDPMAMPLT